MLGILPLASVVFLGFAVVGIILIFVARFGLKSPFFAIKRESWSPDQQEG
jgi:hypothetical protein